MAAPKKKPTPKPTLGKGVIYAREQHAVLGLRPAAAAGHGMLPAPKQAATRPESGSALPGWAKKTAVRPTKPSGGKKTKPSGGKATIQRKGKK